MTSPVVTYSLQVLENEFQANTFETDTQWTPDVLGLSGGGYVVANNSGPIDGGWEIRLDFYGADGQLLAGSVKAAELSTSAGSPPTIAELSNGDVIVVWDDNLGPSERGIQGTIFSPAGEVVVPQFHMSINSINFVRPQVTALGDGFVVTYLDSSNSSGKVYFEVFDANGTSLDVGGFDISTSAPSSDPVVTALEDGGFVITWAEHNGTTYDIAARIFEADGTPREVGGSTDPFIVGTSGNNAQPAVTALPNGNFAVAYADSGWTNEDTGITLTIVAADGSIVEPFIQVNTPSVGIEADPDIAVLDNGFIVVTWTDPGASGDILCRIFDQDGNVVPVLGGIPLNLSSSATADIKSAVSGILAGQFITTWQDSESDGSGGMIKALVTELVRTTTGTSAGETLTGDELRDIMNGEGGNDTLSGGDGDDTLNGGADSDTLSGGNGKDTASYTTATGGVTVALSSAAAQNTGGAGTDPLSSIENLVGSNFGDTLSGTAGDNTISGGGNNDDVKGYAGNDTLNGDTGGDTLNGGASDDTLNGGDNNDTLIGQDGNDTLSGGDGADTASYVGAVAGVTVALSVAGAQNTGGDGTDTLSTIENLIGSGFADTLSGTSGINTISGGGNNDNVKGYSGDDTLNGDKGDDTLNGGANNDTLNGGENNDTLIGQDGNDTLAGGNGVDTASYVGAIAGVTVGLWVAGAQNTGGDGTDTLSSIENLIGSGFADTLSGTSGDNTISGGSNNDDVKGYAGFDVLNGDNGNDTLNGGASNDTLNGGANDDDLIGQDGNDTLTGGTGADDFIFDDAHGADTVADFQNGSDHFDLTAVAGVDEFADLTITDNGATVMVNYGTGSFTIANLADPAVLDAGDFIFA